VKAVKRKGRRVKNRGEREKVREVWSEDDELIRSVL